MMSGVRSKRKKEESRSLLITSKSHLIKDLMDEYDPFSMNQ